MAIDANLVNRQLAIITQLITELAVLGMTITTADKLEVK